ncbi:hypothetical protein K1T71_003310 [Dendrolimus kikuchii]|uniref:Uncharacterized protein n=1 Tax=Dendrolimus kikuchii TaxID=765133 RepID=A0ACC1DBL6_9NEOP|nr:hypothetical protein K1T71_003310 [Dendrolimus kikuchii]
MFLSFLRKYRNMILASAFFFYIGCFLTLNFLRLDCVNAVSTKATSDSSSTAKYEYVVLIISGPDNEIKRDAIRGSWVKLARNIFTVNNKVLYKWNHTWNSVQMQQEIVKYYFVIGTKNLNQHKMFKLKNEQNKDNDLLLLDNLEDSYKNLSGKMLLALKWIHNNIKELKYLIKCDDDSFVRIDLIVKNLEEYGPEMNAPELVDFITFKKILPPFKGLYWGYFNGQAKVYMTGKWEEKDWFLCDRYLPYALGGGYVISQSIVEYISRNADLLSSYNSEDVSMGVWTAPLNGINRVHDTRFDTEWKSRGCSKDMLVRHKQSPSDMFELYKTLIHTHGEKFCKIENTERFSYFYNWNGLPSQCCKA